MASSCPFAGESASTENDWDTFIPIPSHLKSTKYGYNKYLIPLSYLTPFHLVGAGLLLSLILPTIVIGVLACIFLVYPVIRQALRYYKYLPTPHENEIIRTTYSARCEGDFVVFLIGIRPNGAYPFTKTFKNVATAFQTMVAELEANPSWGYMGGDFYVGGNSRKSATLSVQYWRSYEALQKWTHTRMGTHVKLMQDYMKNDRFEGVNGIWHETYKVRDGEYEAIYGNMPPIGLALATKAVHETKRNNGPARMERRKKEKESQATIDKNAG